MYIPPYYREERPEQISATIRDWRFGILVNSGASELHATHLPFLIGDDLDRPGTLVTHLARNNPQWQTLEDAGEVLAIFPGPNAYISPNWYQTQPNVPTWNYAAIHIYGRAKLISEPDQVQRLLTMTVETFDSSADGEWHYHDVPDSFKQRLYPGIVGVEIQIERVFGKFKLSQDKSDADRAGVVAALEQRDEPRNREIAQLMGDLDRGGPGWQGLNRRLRE